MYPSKLIIYRRRILSIVFNTGQNDILLQFFTKLKYIRAKTVQLCQNSYKIQKYKYKRSSKNATYIKYL